MKSRELILVSWVENEYHPVKTATWKRVNDVMFLLSARSPGLLLAYSVMEAELIRHQLHVEFNISVIKEKLHQLLASINTQVSTGLV